jgi:hypothetical protein
MNNDDDADGEKCAVGGRALTRCVGLAWGQTDRPLSCQAEPLRTSPVNSSPQSEMNHCWKISGSVNPRKTTSRAAGIVASTVTVTRAAAILCVHHANFALLHVCVRLCCKCKDSVCTLLLDAAEPLRCADRSVRLQDPSDAPGTRSLQLFSEPDRCHGQVVRLSLCTVENCHGSSLGLVSKFEFACAKYFGCLQGPAPGHGKQVGPCAHWGPHTRPWLTLAHTQVISVWEEG